MSSGSYQFYFEYYGHGTVKLCIVNLSISLMGCVYPYIDGLLVVYTVSEVLY